MPTAPRPTAPRCSRSSPTRSSATSGSLVDGVPLVLPTAFAVDPDGPDEGGTLYLHGSVASRSLLTAPEQDVCVTMTVLDGLVLARSAFHHSMNYRSAVVVGRPAGRDGAGRACAGRWRCSSTT